MTANVPNDRPPALPTVGTIALLSLPAIVGTGFFLGIALVSRNVAFENSHPDLWRDPTVVQRIKMALAVALFGACECQRRFLGLAHQSRYLYLNCRTVTSECGAASI